LFYNQNLTHDIHTLAIYWILTRLQWTGEISACITDLMRHMFATLF